MTAFLSRELSGWGRFPVQECRVARPEKRRDLREAVVADSPEEVSTVLARGLGRSYGDTALNADAGVVLTEKLNRLLDFDAQSGLLHAEGGASFADILETFVPRGWFLPVTPGTKFVTLGGAIACDVHGKNHHRDGCLSEFVQEFDLLLASGETLRCSREENPHAFWATVGGLGLTGVITSAKLKLKPIETASIRASYTRTSDLEETLDEFTRDQNVTYSVAWIDCLASGASLGRSVVIRGEHATRAEVGDRDNPLEFAPKKKAGVPLDFPDFALNPLSVKAFNTLYYAAHPDSQTTVGLESFFWPLDAVTGWNRIYGGRGFVQYQFVMPFETSRDGLTQVLEKVSDSGRASFLAVLKSFGPANLAPLDFPFAGHTLALDLPAAPGIVEFCRELDDIVLEHEGRCYLAKDSTLEAATAHAMYPRLEEWQDIKRELDPENRFQSSLSRRLKLGTAMG